MTPEILTVSGNYFSFNNPENSTYTLEDIAHALSNITRFTGHGRTFYSVAQHSVLVSKLVPPEHALAGLLHDASEAFCGDISSPLKQLLPEYKVIEQRVEKAIFAKFGLPFPMHPDIKKADWMALKAEMKSLLAEGKMPDYMAAIEDITDSVWPVNPTEARRMFMARYNELTKC